MQNNIEKSAINSKWQVVSTTTAFFFLLFSFFFLLTTTPVSAQESFTLTITPPLFQMTASPGQDWSSAIKVVNNNPYDITVYANVMNFTAEGEGGTGKFVPSKDTKDVPGGFSLASWLLVSKQPIFIRAEQSVSVPFTLHVPATAEPGGHYGAILIGTEPPPKTGGSSVRVSTELASLFLLRVNGDVIEEGDIRSFSTEKGWYQEPHANFALRFENKGNVHLLPRGDITIYNMWGKERGKVLFNQESEFGNVLPKSIRKFTFEWAGEPSLFDFGRYKAVATLQIGEKDNKTVYRAVNFWVIPVAATLKIVVSLIVLVWFIVWSIRRYIKRALALETERIRALAGKEPSPQKPAEPAMKKPEALTAQVLARPIVLGAVDLRKAISKEAPEKRQEKEEKTETMTPALFIKKYKFFLIFLLAAIAAIIGISNYFGDVLARYRNFDVQVTNENTKHELQIPKP